MNFDWKVTALGMTENFDAQYCIEPEVELNIKWKLSMLRQDVEKIANCLFAEFRPIANERLQDIG